MMKSLVLDALAYSVRDALACKKCNFHKKTMHALHLAGTSVAATKARDASFSV
jgi:hypothetical protein